MTWTPPTDDVYQAIRDELTVWFHENGAVAMLVFLAAATRDFSVAVIGGSGSGKTTLVRGVLQLVPQDDIVFASRVSGAALFRMQNLGIVVRDEFIPDANFDRVRRLLVSHGEAQCCLAGAGGDLRELKIAGPTAFIDCQPEGHRDFQNSSRAVVVGMSDSLAQNHFHARQVVREATPNGRRERSGWHSFAQWCRTKASELARPLEYVLGVNEEELVPHAAGPHTARRVTQIIKIASAVACIQSSGDSASPRRVTRAHLREAVNLLIEARAVDDHCVLDNRARSFLAGFAQLVGAMEADGTLRTHNVEDLNSITIQKMLTVLNTPYFSELANTVIHKNKRPRDTPASQMWTRAIVTPLLNQLHDANLVVCRKARGREQCWMLTEDGFEMLALGSQNVFHQISQRLKETDND